MVQTFYFLQDIKFINENIGTAIGNAQLWIYNTWVNIEPITEEEIGIQMIFPQFKDLEKIAMYNSEYCIAVGEYGTIIKSSDSGVNWTALTGGAGYHLIWCMFC